MVSIDRFEEIVGAMADELPLAFFEGLNGGIAVEAGCKINPAARADDLLIMGEYRRGGMLGNSIVLYYGSFERLYGRCSEEKLTEEIRHVVRHEMRHHMENRAGVDDLEREDDEFLEQYLRGGTNRKG